LTGWADKDLIPVLALTKKDEPPLLLKSLALTFEGAIAVLMLPNPSKR
jgi:hypothetical protein